MRTIEGKTLEVAPGERAIAYMPVPFGLQVEKVEVAPSTAAYFKIVRADYIGASAMILETGVRTPGIRIELENRSSTPRVAVFFVGLERNLRTMANELENVAERFNREVWHRRRAGQPS